MINILVIILVAVMYVIDLVITLVNYKHRHQPIPEIAADIYDQEKYQKWLRYFMETMRFEVIVKSVSTGLLLILLGFGFFGWLERITVQWVNHPILQTLVFLGVFGLLNMLISLPFDYYATFVIEEKYGFNKTTHKTFFVDILKNILVAAGLGGGLVALLNAIYLEFIGQIWWFVLYAWVILTVVMVILFVLNTKVFVKIFNKLTPLPEGELREKIQALAEEVGFNVKAISVMDASKRSTKLNAFFSGLGKTREVVLFDTLIEKLDEDEILSVLAHELGHAVHKDVPRMLGLQIGMFGLYAVVIGFILQSASLAQAFGLSGVHLGFSLILFSILISPLELILTFPLNFISRKAEYAADAFATELVGKTPTKNAFKVLAQENLANLTPHPLYVLIHYNHPTVPQRLEAIRQKS
ncbi:MAG: M48 family metallopeptidase [Anaerolineaceae bacterium]|nr:M48 family metallopeptidase [Anaerolineaceae bacterium]